MAERTVTRRKQSLNKKLNGREVFLDFEWTYRIDKKGKNDGEYKNLGKNSNSRSYILQEIKDDKSGIEEWQKLKDAGSETPAGKKIAFEKDGKKFIVLSEIFNGDTREETVLNKQWYKQNIDSDLNFKPKNINNWGNLHRELAVYQKGDSSEVFDALEKNRITAIKEDSKEVLNGERVTGVKKGTSLKKTASAEEEDIGNTEDATKDEDNKVNVEIKDPALVDLEPDPPSPNLYYPIDMDIRNMDYLLIKSVVYKPAGNTFIRASGSQPGALTGSPLLNVVPSDDALNSDGSINTFKKENRDLIFLPIPSNIQDGNSVSFSDNSLDALSAGLANLAGNSIDAITGAITALERGEKVDPNIAKIFEDAFGDLGGTAKEMLKKSLLAQAANLTGISNVSFQSLLARESGSILNPNKELLFNGVSLRTFRFSFKLTPRSEDEGKGVKSIIRSLKRNMAPKIVGSSKGQVVQGKDRRSGQYLKTPNVFELQYMKGRDPHPFLNYFKTCALTDMSVKYTGENTYSTYQEGTPVSMIMDLTFKELEPIYDIDYSLDNDSETKSVGY